GDVLGFAGDSALVVWPVESPDDLAEATRSAARSALAVQAAVQGREPLPGSPLGLRASIGAGTLTFMELGGVGGRWHFLAAGDPILQAAEADRWAGEGDVVASPDAWALLEDACAGTPRADGSVRIESVDPSTESPRRIDSASVPPSARLEPYVPRIVRDRHAAGQERWIGEFRPVTVMFVDLAGSRIEEPGEVQRLHRSVGAAQRVLGRYEGALQHLLADDKGITLIGAFGLPPLAHPDDPARCVHAAIELRAALDGLGMAASAGVATGVAFCGVHGGDRRRDYTVLGPVMHRAARLMQSARGSLFCDEASARAAGPALRFDRLPPVQVKGEAAPVAVFAPRRATAGDTVARRPGGSRIGREREHAALARSLGRLLEDGVGDVIEVLGEEGIGKSTLVERLLDLARAEGVTCLVGAGSEIERDSPYGPWRPVVSAMLAVDSPDGDASGAVRELLGPESPSLEMAPLLGAIAPVGLPDTEVTASVRGEVRAENIRRTATELFRRFSADRPVLVVLEDLQWADSASWALILQVARQVPSILLVLTSTPVSAPPEERARLSELPRWRSVALASLTREEVRQLIAERLRLAAVPDPVVEVVHERSGGHPFFAAELAFALRDSGALADLDETLVDLPSSVQWDHLEAALREAETPDTVRGMILRRLDGLTQAEQLVLRVASAIGRRFDLPTVAAVHPESPPEGVMEGILASLESANLIRVESRESVSRYAFAPAIVREVAYDSMLFEQRRVLHRRIAERLERSDAAAASPEDALLGHHWRHAGESGRASVHLAGAAERAAREHANREAVRLWTEALELSAAGESTPDRDASWRLRLGRAYVTLSKYGEAEPHLEAGLARFGQRVPAGPVGGALRLLVQVGIQALHRLRPGYFVGRRAERVDEVQPLIAALEALVETHYVGGRRLATLLGAVQALNLAETVGASPPLARSYASAGAIAGFVPIRRAADLYGRLALETAREAADPATDAWVSLARGIYEIGVGRWDRATTRLEKVRAASERVGDRRRWEDASQHLSGIAWLRGDFEGALELARRLYASAVGIDGDSRSDPAVGSEVHPVQQLTALRLEIWSLMTLGRFDLLPERLEQLRFVLEERKGDLTGQGAFFLLALEAQWALRRGRPEEAREHAER
ncbi:MAG TPA: AAA family ATPase, partial [Gemmatimonadota bacterium]|nr:AAA family ATPase [Gemmatimonadota bacterium]